jgi:hypothetical protein
MKSLFIITIACVIALKFTACGSHEVPLGSTIDEVTLIKGKPDSSMASPDGFKVILFYRSDSSQHSHYEFKYNRLTNIVENSPIQQSWDRVAVGEDLDKRPELHLFRIKFDDWLVVHYIKGSSGAIVFELRSGAAFMGIRKMGQNQYSLHDVVLHVDNEKANLYFFTSDGKFEQLEGFPYSINIVANAFDEVKTNESKDLLLHIGEILSRLSDSKTPE